MKIATFVYQDGFYYPANKAATVGCAILSRMKLRHIDLLELKKHGFDPRFTNGQRIEKVDITV